MKNKKAIISVIFLFASILFFTLMVPKIADKAVEAQKKQTQKLFKKIEERTSEEMEKLYKVIEEQ